MMTALVVICEKDVDPEVLAEIVGRTTAELEKLIPRLDGASLPLLPASVAGVKNLGVAIAALKGAGESGNLKLYLQFRVISLCEGVADIRSIAELIPKGSEAEPYFVKKAAEIC